MKTLLSYFLSALFFAGIVESTLHAVNQPLFPDDDLDVATELLIRQELQKRGYSGQEAADIAAQKSSQYQDLRPDIIQGQKEAQTQLEKGASDVDFSAKGTATAQAVSSVSRIAVEALAPKHLGLGQAMDLAKTGVDGYEAARSNDVQGAATSSLYMGAGTSALDGMPRLKSAIALTGAVTKTTSDINAYSTGENGSLESGLLMTSDSLATTGEFANLISTGSDIYKGQGDKLISGAVYVEEVANLVGAYNDINDGFEHADALRAKALHNQDFYEDLLQKNIQKQADFDSIAKAASSDEPFDESILEGMDPEIIALAKSRSDRILNNKFPTLKDQVEQHTNSSSPLAPTQLASQSSARTNQTATSSGNVHTALINEAQNFFNESRQMISTMSSSGIDQSSLNIMRQNLEQSEQAFQDVFDGTRVLSDVEAERMRQEFAEARRIMNSI